MPSAFLDFTGLSRFLDHLKVLITQSDWQQSDSSEMDYIRNKPTVSVSGQTLVLTGWGNNSTGTSYTVTFMLNDGTQTVYDTQTVTSGNTASVPATNPTRTDYSFNGWYEDSAGTTAFNFSTPITANKTLYAKWTTQSSGSSGTITLGSYGDTSDMYGCIVGFVSSTGRYNYAACGNISPTAYESSPISIMALVYSGLEFSTVAEDRSLNGNLVIGTQVFTLSAGMANQVTTTQMQYLINNIGNTLNWSFAPTIVIEDPSEPL